MKRTIIFTVLMAFFVLLSGCNRQEDNSPIETIDLDTLEDIVQQSAGKVVFVNIFGTWCPPCKKEVPGFVELYAKGDLNFEIIGLAVDTSKKDVEDFIETYGINYPVYHINASSQRTLNANLVPTTIIFDTSGQYHSTVYGEINKSNMQRTVYIVERLDNGQG